MNIWKNPKEALTLAAAVGFFVSLWGTFHATIGIKLAWPAFVSAAVFFAAGHQFKDALKIIAGHATGVFWGILFFKFIDQLIARQLPSLLVPLIVLSVLSIAAVLITHLGIGVLSHLPSLFSGWAVSVGTLSGLSPDQFLPVTLDTLLSLQIGIVFLGVGIPFLHNTMLAKSESSGKGDEKSPSKTENDEQKKKQKIQDYVIPYRSEEKHEVENNMPYDSDLAEIKSEIIKLSNYLPSQKTSAVNNASETSVSIVGICGSPHKKGSTIVYLQRILDAAASMGNVQTELITIAGKNIKPCLGCKTNKCFGECIIKDDMHKIYPVLRNADGIVIGSPSYFGTFSGQLKILIDRLRVMRHTNFQLANKVIAPLSVAGRRHGGQEITNLDIIQAMMRHNTIIVNDGTAVCQLGATGWSHTFDDPKSKVDDDVYGLQTCEGVGLKIVEIARAIKSSGLQQQAYEYNAKIGKR